MNILDLRTVLLSYLISNAICAAVMASLWLQNRKRSPELGFWLADFIMQFLAVLLIMMRGNVPDFVSVVIGGGLAIGGTILLYVGLERYVGRPSSQLPNYVLLAVFLLVHTYFSVVQTSLVGRTLNITIALLIICVQCAWLLLRRVDRETRQATRMAGLIFAAYSLVNLIRVIVNVTMPPVTDFFRSGLYDTLGILTYQMLFIGLTFELFLMVNGRLIVQLERDITEREGAESERVRLLSVLEASLNEIYIFAPDTLKFQYVNASAIRNLGYSPEHLKTLTPFDLKPDFTESSFREMIEPLLRHQKDKFVFETAHRRADGSLYPAEVQLQLVESTGVRVFLAVIVDITERKRQEDELLAAQRELRRLLAEADLSRRSLLSVVEDQKTAEEETRKLNIELEQRVRDRTAQLESANRELEAFVYSVSHDLRAPLRGIDGWSLALLEDHGEQLDERAHQFLGRVRGEAQRMGQLIDALLQLSRVTRAEMRRRPVDLSELARTVAARLKDAQPERQVEMRVQPGLTANGDARLLEIVLTNLLDNAWKFTGKRPLASIELGKMDVDGRAAFFVRDNGAGFDMTSADKLFGAFQRMHRSSEFPGTGIGLATVQRIIHRHGGRVWAEAEVDRGATLYFSLDPREPSMEV